jgi:hypothetical protein
MQSGKGGIAIFLSSRAKAAWIATGAQKPIMSGVVARCPRWTTIKFKTMEKTAREFLAVSTYHLYNDMDEILIEEFYDKCDDFLSEHTSGNLTTIIRCDANVIALGLMRSNEEGVIVGKHGTGGEEARNDTCRLPIDSRRCCTCINSEQQRQILYTIDMTHSILEAIK